MRNIIYLMLAVCTLWLLYVPSLYGSDMRIAHREAEEAKETLIKKAADELKAAEREAAESREHIINDKSSLKKVIIELEAENKRLKQEIGRLTNENSNLQGKEKQLILKLDETDSMISELIGVIRVNAKDISTLIDDNLQTSWAEQDPDLLHAIAGQSKFPAMEDIRRMVGILFKQIKASGEVTLRKGNIINRAGEEREADILALGCFTAAYRSENETGFLSYSTAGKKLYALSRLPSGRIQRQISRYMEGRDEAVPIDVSRGAGLRQLTHKLSLWEQISSGGLLVWPILAILGLGAIIVLERVFFLFRRRVDSDNLIQQVQNFASDKIWEDCINVCNAHVKKPLARVLKAGLNCYHMSREDMENALQEAILREIPPMERFLSTLGMLAAIAPLLGLLGTVTGMIDTFHVITLHGTGDPRMMSGGISVALVTTMLGLSVAIPIMLAHTLLSRAVENRISEMEEKAVTLVNTVHKSKGSECPE
ncbi:MAG: MotA/TolQ/ExbB proton channel family protein [Desulfobacteraceae bacterium]|jgi:biopolymer transport protein ExbB